MAKVQERQKLNVVIKAIESAGYNPFMQLTGYMATGNEAYITRQGGARALVHSLDRKLIQKYLAEHSQMQLA